MTEIHRKSYLNGSGKIHAENIANERKETVYKNNDNQFWRKLQINEFTFSVCLFILSLTIVLGKLFLNYDHWVNIPHILPTVPSLESIYTKISIPDISELNKEKLVIAKDKLLNVSSQYEEAVANAVVMVSSKYGWLMKAIISGLSMMSFTWFIIYKDSSVPGVNPPSPFSPGKKRIYETSRMQLNYFVGLLNGILIFFYMCL